MPLKISAKSEDGIIEGIESDSDNFLVGVQWHPELLEDPTHYNALLSALIAAC